MEDDGDGVPAAGLTPCPWVPRGLRKVLASKGTGASRIPGRGVRRGGETTGRGGPNGGGGGGFRIGVGNRREERELR